MCVKVFLAEDSELMRKAIRNLFSECEDIAVVGEAATFSETIQKAAALQPDVVVFDLHMADDANGRQLPAGPKLLAISFAYDDEAKASADLIGAKLLDKLELGRELIPAILAEVRTPETTA